MDGGWVKKIGNKIGSSEIKGNVSYALKMSVTCLFVVYFRS